MAGRIEFVKSIRTWANKSGFPNLDNLKVAIDLADFLRNRFPEVTQEENGQILELKNQIKDLQKRADFSGNRIDGLYREIDDYIHRIHRLREVIKTLGEELVK